MRILVTGTAGYVGSLLAERLAADAGVQRLVATDLRRRPALSAAVLNGKIREEPGRLEDAELMRRLEAHLPLDVVIHAAFAIRPGYGRRKRAVERANIDSCRNVFRFCFAHSVPRLVYFSTAAVYGAYPGNRPDRYFSEADPLREVSYPYGVQKRQTEVMLRDLYEEAAPGTTVIVVRPCAITGPRFLEEPTKKITLVAFLKRMVPFIPQLSPEWARQYLHEEDLVRAIGLLLSVGLPSGYEVFNLAPPDYLTAAQIAEILNKRVLRIPPWMVGAAFKTLWHLTRGRAPTPSGAVRFFRHPVNLDGSKITRLGFRYQFDSGSCLASV